MASHTANDGAGQILLFEVEQTRHGDGSFTVRPKRLTDGREIGVGQAAKMLGFKDRETVYRLIELGDIKAWKPKSERGNGKWRIDWQSVADYKSARLAAARNGES
jgi:excisionase family DNA binding protein